MHVAHLLFLASTASAFTLPALPGSVSDLTSALGLSRRKDGSSGKGSGNDDSNGKGGGNSCPSVWNSISKDLTAMFLSGGQCNDAARAAIRLNFHDCGAWETKLGATGGCDGSLILSDELSRGENKGLAGIAAKIQSLAGSYHVGVADMIVFAGSHAIVTCPGGPVVKTFIGRKDSSQRAPNGLLPNVSAPAEELYQLFQNKGFDDVDLAALLGAHSTSTQSFVDESKKNASQDSTPGIWDVKYYSETTKPVGNDFVFQSDAALAAHPKVGKQFAGFVNNQGKWNGKFADAMARMSLFGVASTNGMADCTNALPKSTNIKREMRGMPIYGRRG